MARIFYGVQGDGSGHVNRARIITQELPQHEFLFVGGGTVQSLRTEGYPVINVPFLDTFYRDNRVDIYGTLSHGLKVLLRSKYMVKKVSEAIRHFDPDLIITDYEFFTPIAARKLGRFCVSLDHQHILTQCDYDLSNEQYMSGLMAKAVIRGLFSIPKHYLIVSFFHLSPRDQKKAEVFPAIIKPAATEHHSSLGDHILVYQTSPTFERLFPFLETLDYPCTIYGFGSRPPQGNLLFKAPSSNNFIKDLASCRYVLANGGHNVISEALYFGKPVFSFPIANHYEQFVNARFLAKFGYGSYTTSPYPSHRIFDSFQGRLDEYRARIKKSFIPGNERLIRRLEELIACGRSHPFT